MRPHSDMYTVSVSVDTILGYCNMALITQSIMGIIRQLMAGFMPVAAPYPRFLQTTEHAAIDRALDDVMNAGAILHDRRCAIGIANEGKKTRLCFPQWTFYSGQIHAAMPYEIEPGQTVLNLFIKKAACVTGTVGVVTYDIDGADYKVAIMWSVPFDFNIYTIWFNMKVYPKTVATDINMWKELYYNRGACQANGWKLHQQSGVKIRGTMTDNFHAKLIVWVDADALSQKAIEMAAQSTRASNKLAELEWDEW